MTVPQVRQLLVHLLQPQPPSPAAIAEAIKQVLRRNEEARIYHWLETTGRFPPRRNQPSG